MAIYQSKQSQNPIKKTEMATNYSNKIGSKDYLDRKRAGFLNNDSIGYESTFTHNFNFANIQTKLKVSQPGDEYEQEADRMAKQIMETPVLDSIPLHVVRKNGRIDRKCSCQMDKNEEEKDFSINRKILGIAHQVSPTEIPEQFSNIISNTGIQIDSNTRGFMESKFGYDFSNVRIHTDDTAAKSAYSINALSYTAGTNIVFGKGQYQPNSLEGKKLLAHELVHVIQQSTSKGRESIEIQKKELLKKNEPQVNRVVLSCADNIIIFETPANNYSYKLDKCDLTEGEYNADVTIEGGIVKFNLGSVDKGTRFHFNFTIQPGQENPARLFKGQKKVTIKATNQSLKSTEQQLVKEPDKFRSSYDAFKRLVRKAGKARMTNNSNALEQWKIFLKQVLTPKQVKNQVVAEDLSNLTFTAIHKGTVDYLDQYGRERNPAMREYQRGLISKERCPSCHAIMGAEAYEKSLSDFEKQGEDWIAPSKRIASIASEEQQFLSPRPNLLTNKQNDLSTQKWTKINTPLYPTATAMSQSLQIIRPYLNPLGPMGYKVLPQSVMESKIPESELLSLIIKYIEKRQSDYLEFNREIDDPDFDYMMLRPIVRDLLPLASAEVQYQVNADIEKAERWETVKAIVGGILFVATLLLIVFPPTTALGIAAVGAFDVGMGAYGAYEGYQAFKQGRLLNLTIGTNDVVDPEQQEAADLMMGLGALNVALGGLGIASGSMRVLKIVRSTPKTTGMTGGIGGAGISEGRVTDSVSRLETIEAEINGQKVTVSKLNTDVPDVKLTAADGTVIKEEPMNTINKSSSTPGSSTNSPLDIKPSTSQGPYIAQPIKPSTSNKLTYSEFPERSKGLEDINGFHKSLISGAGDASKVKVVAKVVIDGKEFYGINAIKDNPFIGLSAHSQHAEIYALGQAAANVNTTGKSATMWITETPCAGACLTTNFKGNIVKAIEQMGLKDLTIHTPTETIIVTPKGVVFYRVY